MARRAGGRGAARDPRLPPRPGGRAADAELEGSVAAGARRARPRRRSRRPASARSRARPTAPRGGCCCARPSSSRRSSAATRRPSRPGGSTDCPAVALEMDEVLRGGRARPATAASRARAHGARRRRARCATPTSRARASSPTQALDGAARGRPAGPLRRARDARQIAWWLGDLDRRRAAVAQQALELARARGRKDLESEAPHEARRDATSRRLDLDEAEPLVDRACELAEESGSIVDRAGRGARVARAAAVDARRARRGRRRCSRRRARSTRRPAPRGARPRRSTALAWVAWRKGDLARAERYFRESIRILKPLEDRGTLCESQRGLAQVLVAGQARGGRAVRARARGRRSARTTRARARRRGWPSRLVRAAQGRDEEAEELLREALDVARGTEFEYIRFELLTALSRLPARARDATDEAQALEDELSGLGESRGASPTRSPRPRGWSSRQPAAAGGGARRRAHGRGSRTQGRSAGRHPRFVRPAVASRRPDAAGSRPGEERRVARLGHEERQLGHARPRQRVLERPRPPRQIAS